MLPTSRLDTCTELGCVTEAELRLIDQTRGPHSLVFEDVTEKAGTVLSEGDAVCI